jgi:hypothetical protein
MRRRDLFSLAAVTAMTWKPTLAEVTMPRIGFIQAGARQDNQGLLDAFHDGLSVLGRIDGSNIAILDKPTFTKAKLSGRVGWILFKNSTDKTRT